MDDFRSFLCAESMCFGSSVQRELPPQSDERLIQFEIYPKVKRLTTPY